MMLRDETGGIWMSNLKREKFITEKWLEREASSTEGKRAGDWKVAEKEGVISCDSMGCLFQKNDKTVLIAKSAEAVALDCERVDVFIAPDLRLDKSLCPSKSDMMIDKDKLRKMGAHAVYLGKENAEITSVAQHRGWRPWVPGFRSP
jgi:hypothetical protein